MKWGELNKLAQAIRRAHYKEGTGTTARRSRTRDSSRHDASECRNTCGEYTRNCQDDLALERAVEWEAKTWDEHTPEQLQPPRRQRRNSCRHTHRPGPRGRSSPPELARSKVEARAQLSAYEPRLAGPAESPRCRRRGVEMWGRIEYGYTPAQPRPALWGRNIPTRVTPWGFEATEAPRHVASIHEPHPAQKPAHGWLPTGVC